MILFIFVLTFYLIVTCVLICVSGIISDIIDGDYKSECLLSAVLLCSMWPYFLTVDVYSSIVDKYKQSIF